MKHKCQWLSEGKDGNRVRCPIIQTLCPVQNAGRSHLPMAIVPGLSWLFTGTNDPFARSLCVGLKHHRREFPALSPRTGHTHCPASQCLENVLGFLIGAKFAHDGICRKSFPPFPVGWEALSLLARLGTRCQSCLAPGKRDSPEQSPRGAQGMPAKPSPAQEDASCWQSQSLTLPSQWLPNEFQGLSV